MQFFQGRILLGAGVGCEGPRVKPELLEVLTEDQWFGEACSPVLDLEIKGHNCPMYNFMWCLP
jgi:hypothetical protein